MARQLDCHTLLVLTNTLGAKGRPAEAFADIPEEEKFANVVSALQQALEQLPSDIHLNLEPLNTRLDHPGYWLTDMKAAARIVREVGDPRLKILCDLYHQRVMGDDLVKVVAEHLPLIGHFHLADVPGRHEPGTGEVDWLTVLRRIKRGGYRGYIGFELFPSAGSDAALTAIQSLWTSI